MSGTGSTGSLVCGRPQERPVGEVRGGTDPTDLSAEYPKKITVELMEINISFEESGRTSLSSEYQINDTFTYRLTAPWGMAPSLELEIL